MDAGARQGARPHPVRHGRRPCDGRRLGRPAPQQEDRAQAEQQEDQHGDGEQTNHLAAQAALADGCLDRDGFGGLGQEGWPQGLADSAGAARYRRQRSACSRWPSGLSGMSTSARRISRTGGKRTGSLRISGRMKGVAALLAVG